MFGVPNHGDKQHEVSVPAQTVQSGRGGGANVSVGTFLSALASLGSGGVWEIAGDSTLSGRRLSLDVVFFVFFFLLTPPFFSPGPGERDCPLGEELIKLFMSAA